VKSSQPKHNAATLLLALGMAWGAALPLRAEHGSLTTTQRDGWIDTSLADLVNAGWTAKPDRPLGELTNLEVAQLTAQAAQQVNDLPPSATPGLASAGRSLNQLLDEFDVELSLMNVQVAQLEDRLNSLERLNEKFTSLQAEDLRKTGTQVAGDSRSYFNTFRGFGANAIYKPMDYNDIFYADIKFRSVPVPSVLFDADVRLIRTIGWIYGDPVNPNFDIRWLSFNNVNDVANLTAGDFYRHYTPLTLWNSEIPIYNFIEPTSYYRARKDVEELVYMDHGPDWHMRGIEASSDQEVLDNKVISSFHLQAMGGELSTATPLSFGNNYAGAEGAMDFFGEKLELKAAGLMLWNDTGTLDLVYNPNIPSTFARQYQVGSLSAKGDLPIKEDVSLSGTAEYAGSWYLDDANNSASVYQDWAFLGTGSVNVQGAHLTVKYLSNGPNFFSPGTQTNRYSPITGAAGSGYLTNNQNLDDALNGYLNGYVFQNVTRPSFAPYDRMAENALPYGDATPNREGYVLGFSADIGKGGWVKPQASYLLNLHEIQPDYVQAVSEIGVLPIDSDQSRSATRSFTGYEGAVSADFAKGLEGLPTACDLAVDYKHQETDLGIGAPPFSVDTFIVCADAGPFPQIPLFEGLTLSGAFEMAQSTGSEYTLAGYGTPPTLGEYISVVDSGQWVNQMKSPFSYQALNITRTSYAFGFKCPLSPTFDIHGDWFYNQYTWSDVPGFDRREQIWRLTYDVSF